MAWETEYGVLLLVKVGLVLPLLALGAYNNRFAVPRLRRQIASAAERRRFIMMAAVELAIVGVTAGLVNARPARTEIAMQDVAGMGLWLGPMRADMEVMPQLRPERLLFCDTLRPFGIAWRVLNARNISVARRASVAWLDDFAGPKR